MKRQAEAAAEVEEVAAAEVDPLEGPAHRFKVV